MDINKKNNIVETISSIIKSCNKESRTIEYMKDHANKSFECIIKDFNGNNYEQKIPNNEWDEIYETGSGVMIYINKIQIVISEMTFGVVPHMGTRRGKSFERIVYYLSCNDDVIIEWHYRIYDDIMYESKEWKVHKTSSGECIEKFEFSN